MLTYVHISTFPYNISQYLIGYGVFSKHPSLSKAQTCENIQLTVSKNCDPLFSLMTPLLASLWILWTPVYEILIRTLSTALLIGFNLAQALCSYFTEHCPDPVSFYSGPLRKCSHTGQAYSLCRPAPLKALSI